MANFTLKTASGSNAISIDPHPFIRKLYHVGGTHKCISGRRVRDIMGIHYDFELRWADMTAAQYEALRALYYAGEMLYFDDGNVPPLVETEAVAENATYTFDGITRPSASHIASKLGSTTFMNAERDILIFAAPNGSSKYFDGGDNLDIDANDFSLSAWVYLQSLYGGATRGTIISKGTATNSRYFLAVRPDGVVWAHIGGASNHSAYSGKRIDDRQWHHIAATFDRSGNVQIYIDGEVSGSPVDISGAAAAISNAAALRIGLDSAGTAGTYFRGYMGDVRVWVGGLWTAAEIIDQYENYGDNTEGGTLSSSWYFTDAAAATTINDDTGAVDLSLAGGDTTNYGTHTRANSEYSDAYYSAIGAIDSSWASQLGGAPNYGFHKYTIVSGITQANTLRLRAKIVGYGTDPSPDSETGLILYGWDQKAWVKLGEHESGSDATIEYSIQESDVAQLFVNSDDSSVRLLAQSKAAGQTGHSVFAHINYVELEINEGLDLVVELTHIPILDGGDVIWVKNLTTIQTLELTTDYIISGREITVTGQNDGDEIEVKYNSYHEVTFVNMPDQWLSGDPGSSRERSAVIRFRTLTQGVKDS